MPKVKPDILKWAREEASKLSIDDASKKLGLKDGIKVSATEKLLSYERGEKEPSRALLLKMSKQYRLPLLTFYLDRPPVIGDRGEDFRTLPNNFDISENIFVDVLIRDLRARQSIIRETLIDADENHEIDFIGKLTSDDSVISVAKTIMKVLDVDLEAFRNQASYKEAFRLLRQNAEKAGVFVLLQGNLGSHHSNIDVMFFRGFALADAIAPFIVINDRDAESAWSFTLIHEMAHLVLGKTGISNVYGEKKIEKFCNDVASELLLPKKDFSEFQPSIQSVELLQSEISDYAYSKKISSSHIAYRLYRRGDIDKHLWTSLRDYYHSQWLENKRDKLNKNKKNDGGPNYYVVKKYKMGSLVELVQRLTYSGALTTTKAGMVLDVKPLKVHRIFSTPELA